MGVGRLVGGSWHAVVGGGRQFLRTVEVMVVLVGGSGGDSGFGGKVCGRPLF